MQLYRTQLCQTQLFRAQICHTHTHNFVTHNFVTHNFVTHSPCHAQLFRTQLFHTHLSHTTLSPTTLSHTIFHTHLSLTCNFSLTHNFVTQSFTHSFVTNNLVIHNSFTHNFVTDNLSHTALSLTIFHPQLFHSRPFTHTTLSHTTFSHTTLHIQLLKWLTLHHLLWPFFFLRAASTTCSDYWKKLTCGVIRSFNYYMFAYFSVMCCHKRGNLIYVRRVGTIRNMLRRLAGSTLSQDISRISNEPFECLWDGVNVPSEHAERSAPEVDSAPTRRRSLECISADHWFTALHTDFWWFMQI